MYMYIHRPISCLNISPYTRNISIYIGHEIKVLSSVSKVVTLQCFYIYFSSSVYDTEPVTTSTLREDNSPTPLDESHTTDEWRPRPAPRRSLGRSPVPSYPPPAETEPCHIEVIVLIALSTWHMTNDFMMRRSQTWVVANNDICDNFQIFVRIDL